MPDYPVNLPFLEQSGYEESAAAVLARPDVSAQLASVAEIANGAPRPLTGRIILEGAAEFTAFETFFNDTCDGGASAFTFDDVAYRFRDLPSVRGLGGELYEVTVALELVPVPDFFSPRRLFVDGLPMGADAARAQRGGQWTPPAAEDMVGTPSIYVRPTPIANVGTIASGEAIGDLTVRLLGAGGDTGALGDTGTQKDTGGPS